MNLNVFTKVNIGHSKIKYLIKDFYVKFCCISCYPEFLTSPLSKSMTDLHYSNTNISSSLCYYSILKCLPENISLKYNRGNMKKISFIVWENYIDNLDFIAVQYSMNLCNYNFQFLGFRHLLSFSSIFEILVLFRYILWSYFHFLSLCSFTWSSAWRGPISQSQSFVHRFISE